MSDSCFCEFTTHTGTVYRAIEAEMTHTRGIMPSICRMQIADYDTSGLASVGGTSGKTGTLVFGDGVNGSVVFYDCRVQEMSVEKTTTEYRSTLKIADRRWTWGGLPLTYQEWNTRDSQGTIVDVADERASAYGIGSYLIESELVEIGSYNLQLPNGTTPGQMPFFKWDKMTPGACLNELCEVYDASIVLQPNTDMLHIFADGSFLPPPASGSLYNREETRFLGDPVPQYMVVYGGKRRIEIDMPLTPVLLDVDGSIKGYGFHDADGSSVIYSTNPGRDCSWLTPIAPPFTAMRGVLTQLIENKAQREIALECVNKSYLKWYRLPGTTVLYADGTTDIYAPKLWRDVVLERNSLESVEGDVRYAKAIIYGTGIGEREMIDHSVSNNAMTGILKGAFNYDKATGVIRLPKPIYRHVHGTIEPGTLWLRAVVCDQPGAWLGTSFDGTSTLIDPGFMYTEVHDDVVFEYGSANINNGTAINLAMMGSMAESYFGNMRQKYERMAENNPTTTKTYPGIHAFSCDGLYQQVSWSMGYNKAPQTVVSRDCDHNIRASAEISRQSIWQGKLWRDRQNRASKVINEQFKSNPDSSDSD